MLHAPDVGTEKKGLWLALVIAAHALGLGIVLQAPSPSKPSVSPPSVVGMLIASAPTVALPQEKKATPDAPRPRPKPPRPAKHEPVSRPPVPRQPAPPRPAAPPSERAVSIPTPPVESTDTPAMESVPAPEAAESGLPSEENATPTATPAGDGDPRVGLALELPRTDAAHLNNPAPVYPNLSRRFGEQGRVLLDVYILPDGGVGDIRLNTSSGFARLDQAALAAVRRWRFVPARRGDEPIAYWYIQPVTFSLDR